MNSMKKIIGLALLAGATVGVAGTASAEGSFTGNIALTSDYVFRGISQTQGDMAVQGGFDYTNGIFYAGTWASNVDFGTAYQNGEDSSLETDLYFGITPTLGPVALNLGVVGYFYPGAETDDLDYVEFRASGTITPAEGFTLGGSLFYSPEFTLNGGDGVYYEANAAYTVNEMFSISGAVGHQSVDTAGYFVVYAGPDVDEYTTWNLGATATIGGFGVDLRYFDTDEDIVNFIPNEVVSDGRVSLTVRRTL